MEAEEAMPAHIGIVACSTEVAALCYRPVSLYGSERLGPHVHPEVSLHSHCLAGYMVPIERDQWDGDARLMLSSARKLHAPGARFPIRPDTTIHLAFPMV